MGIFNALQSSSVVAKRFKNTYSELHKLLVDYSFSELRISDSVAKMKISSYMAELKDITKATNDPFSEYFNIYTNSTSGMKVRISTGTALILLHILIDRCVVYNKLRITSGVFDNALSAANQIAENTYERTIYINKTINI